MYGSKASEAIQGKERHFPLHLGVLAIKKGAFRSPSTTVGQYNLHDVLKQIFHRI